MFFRRYKEKYIQALNGVKEGKARMGEGGRDEEVASSKKKNRIED